MNKDFEDIIKSAYGGIFGDAFGDALKVAFGSLMITLGLWVVVIIVCLGLFAYGLVKLLKLLWGEKICGVYFPKGNNYWVLLEDAPPKISVGENASVTYDRLGYDLESYSEDGFRRSEHVRNDNYDRWLRGNDITNTQPVASIYVRGKLPTKIASLVEGEKDYKLSLRKLEPTEVKQYVKSQLAKVS